MPVAVYGYWSSCLRLMICVDIVVDCCCSGVLSLLPLLTVVAVCCSRARCSLLLVAIVCRRFGLFVVACCL